MMGRAGIRSFRSPQIAARNLIPATSNSLPVLHRSEAMPYLIDGHNLIGKMSGASLSDPDDEARLVQRLRAHFASLGKKAVVIFDRGLPGGSSRWSTPLVEVRFAPAPKRADDLILERLRRLPDVKNWTVVSSDREVMDSAQRLGARVLRSEHFANELARRPDEPDSKKSGMPNEDEVQYWEDLFKKRKDE